MNLLAAESPVVIETALSEQDGSTAQSVTMDLKGVDILDVLKILAKKTGLNILAGRGVQGTVTLYLQDVNVYHALRGILETAGLAYVEQDNLVRVMTAKEYETIFGRSFYDYRTTKSFNFKHAKAAEVSEIFNLLRSNVGKVIVDDRTNTVIISDIPQVMTDIASAMTDIDIPTESEVFNLRYSQAEDIQEKLKSIVNPVTGSLEIDSRSNKIFVRDLPDRVEQVRALIHEFDMQPAQVLIEAKVMEVQLDDQMRFGIDWDAVFDRDKDSPITINAPLTVTTPSSGPLSNLTLSSFQANATGDDFVSAISALEGIGKTNILSSPRLTVLNNQEAKLAVATREPFVSQTVIQGDSTATTADNVQFVDVGVTLIVKPTITDDDFVLIKIKPAVSSAGTPLELQGVSSGSNTTFTRTRIPVITTQEVETTVIVKNGTTIVMGGLIQDRVDKTMSKIPVLGDIPFLGAAFRNKSEDFTKVELVIFLTPRIIYPNQQTTETARFFKPDGALKLFDEVGDAAYTNAYDSSNTPFAAKFKPFWDKNASVSMPSTHSTTTIVQADDSISRKKPKRGELIQTSSPAPQDLRHLENKQVMILPEGNSSMPAYATVQTTNRPLPINKRIAQKQPINDSAKPVEMLIEKLQDPAPLPTMTTTIPEVDSETLSWSAYFEKLRYQISESLKQNQTLAEMSGEIRLEFDIDQQGIMSHIQVLDSKEIRGSGQKLLITEVLSNQNRYSPLPQKYGAKKRIHLTVQV